MSDAETTPATATDDHDSGHGHAPAGEPLGPVNVTTWAYALAGSLLGVLMVLALYIARGG
jgi:hypothetical protein